MLFLALLALPVSSAPATTPTREPVVLVLVDGLAWEEIEREPGLEKAFQNGAVANLSTAEGDTPEDPRLDYLFLGAGSRVNTALLPGELPEDPAKLADAFTGPASSVRPGLFGEALAEDGIEAAAIGDRAGLVVMDQEGRVPLVYDEGDPAQNLEEAIEDGAGLVAVEARDAGEAAKVVETALALRLTVAVVSPNAPPGSPNLTPSLLSGLEGLLYSPTTRTAGLISNTDVAPTLLDELGIRPPPGMQGRPATVRPGTMEEAQRLHERLAFATEKQPEVWAMVGAAGLAALLLGSLWSGRNGLYAAILSLAALPAGALLSAALPLTNVPAVAATTVIFAGTLAGFFWKLSGSTLGALAGVCLTTAALVTADAAAGGALMKFSTMGYDPAYGTRFYGIGNEYAAVLAGALTMGLGALAHRRRMPLALPAVAGVIAVLALGLPVMGADVGGSLALGFGLGATVGLLRGNRARGVALWAGGGLLFAVALFMLSGVLFPDVSHGSRATGGEAGLFGIAVRKLLLSLQLLLNPILIPLLGLAAAVIYAGWRRTRGTALAAGMLGAAITALASGALNDSGIVATLLALIYPAAAALGTLLDPRPPK